jgi:hypothetical protein
VSAFAELDLVARTDQLERATAEIRRIGVEGDKAEAKVKKSTSGMEDGMRKLAAAAGTLAGSLAAAFSVGAYIRMADSWSDMRSQLGAAIGDMDNAGKMMQRMTQIANASYSPLDQTVQVYARNVSVLRDLGVSASGAADFTEALNHALVSPPPRENARHRCRTRYPRRWLPGSYRLTGWRLSWRTVGK